MAKRYIRMNWQNSPSTVTPISAENLNKMDKGIDDVDSALEDHISSIIHTDTINDVTKYPSSAVTYGLGQEVDVLDGKIDAINDGLALKIITGDVLAYALTCKAGITSFYATEPVINIPSGTYTLGVVLKSAGNLTHIFVVNRANGNINKNTYDSTKWLGWKSITMTDV